MTEIEQALSQHFAHLIETVPELQRLANEPDNRKMLERLFQTGITVGTQIQAQIDEPALVSAISQRDFLDIVCSQSTDPCTRLWRSGFETGCPEGLIWASRSGGIGVEGEDAHRAAGAVAEDTTSEDTGSDLED